MYKTHHLAAYMAMLCIMAIGTNRLYAQGKNCDNDSTGLIPLNDLGAGFYEGFQGGLYPFGANSENPASTHYKKGKSFAKTLKPLDTLGNINYEEGVVLLGGFGPSIPGQMMTQLINIVRDTMDVEFNTNPCFNAINLCAGGKGLAEAIGTTSEGYWNSLLEKVSDKHYSPLQVQVGWMYFSDKYDSLGPEPSFPETPQQITEDFISYLQIMMEYFPNMKIVFVSGRHFGGYADTTLDHYISITEPASYWNNFSVKWLIERQINADPALRYYGPGTKVPFISWGPYFWADGGIPRATDGELYQCIDFNEPDGYHLSDSTYIRNANDLMQLLYTSDFSKTFVKNGLTWSACISEPDSVFKAHNEIVDINNNGITIYPNPASENIYIYRANATGKLLTVEIRNAIGQQVYQESAAGVDVGSIPIDVAGLNNGIYFIRTLIEDNDTKISKWYEGQFIKQ